MRALVVDDSRAMRALLKALLREFGFDVAEAGNGQEGLARLKETGQTELALVDWNMPVMNGYEFVRAVRADETMAGMKLVMVTAETEMENVSRALEAGVSEYIMKPFTKEGLQEKLEMIGIHPAHH